MTLKIGSKGEDVKRLQTFLEIASDGNFGPGTDAAVKRWQQENGLVADGIVGQKTWEAMSLATTDEQERVEITGSIIFQKAYLPKGEYIAGPTMKEWMFLHHTAGWNDPFQTIKGWAADTRGPIATEFVLGGQKTNGKDDTKDGVLVQAFPSGSYGWHLGTGNSLMHRNSVAVELCNFGQIINGMTYVGTPVVSSQIVTLANSFRGHKTWHRYSDKQISVLRELILYVANRDSIDVRKGLPELIKMKGASAFDFIDINYCATHRGLWCHNNVRPDKFDLFPQPELMEMLVSL